MQIQDGRDRKLESDATGSLNTLFVIFRTVDIRNFCIVIAFFTHNKCLCAIYSVPVGCAVTIVEFITAAGVSCNLCDVSTVSIISIVRNIVVGCDGCFVKS